MQRELTRLERRYNILQDESKDIFDVCLELHMSVVRSGDPLPDDVEDRYVRFLQEVIDTWEPSGRSLPSQWFDGAVKELVGCTLAEYRYYLRLK